MYDKAMYDKVKEISSALEAPMFDFCQRIVRIPSFAGDEEEVSNVIMEEMRRLGYDEVFRDEWGNVVGLIHGSSDGPVIMFNGHMDVTSIGDPKDWGDYDPFGGQIDTVMARDWTGEKEEMAEVIHGRGTCDMKCGLVPQIYAGAVLVELRKLGYSWKGTYLMASVAMEEFGDMVGTIKLTEETLPAKGIEIDGMVSGEPTSAHIALGSRGRMEIKIAVEGRCAPGSMPWVGINAIEKAAKLIIAIEKRYEKDVLEHPHLGKQSITPTVIECEPYNTATIPNRCTLVYDRRLIPGETLDGAVAEIQEIVDKLAQDDPDFIAAVSVNTNERTAFTGKSAVIETKKGVWIIDRTHPFVKACAEGLAAIGEEVRYKYWPFNTDVPQVGAKMKKPAIGYAGIQEYCGPHSPTEMARVDLVKRGLAGNVAIFLKVSELPKDSFTVD